MDEHFYFYNGFLFKKGRPILSGDHPGQLYGDGVFETMRYFKGAILNLDAHKKRLSHALHTLGYEPEKNFFPSVLENIKILLQKNKLTHHAKIRLAVMRAHNYFIESSGRMDYLIDCVPVSVPEYLTSGLRMAIYHDSKKGTGILSNLKSSNYLLNIQATKFAHENGFDDAIILNANGRICECTVANLFFVEGGKIFTPPLAEGCVSGVMRKWLLDHLPEENFSVSESECTLQRLLSADEIFATNAIRWIQPISMIDGKKFGSGLTEKLYRFTEKRITAPA